jgi:SanA protein
MAGLFKNKSFRIMIAFLAIALIIIYPGILIDSKTKSRIYSSVDAIPKNKTGLLLGTAKYLTKGINPYYQNRIDATVELYNSHKIDFVLISGDNSRKSYNEPALMKEDLIRAGIPESRIYLDYAGFRTLDSVVRAKEIFGLDSMTVISQKFHNARAIYIAGKKGIYSIGYNAEDIPLNLGFKTRIREIFARDKMMLDLIFNTKPKFSGERIEIK